MEATIHSMGPTGGGDVRYRVTLTLEPDQLYQLVEVRGTSDSKHRAWCPGDASIAVASAVEPQAFILTASGMRRLETS